ncbi:hypothetical protein, partial [Microbacterium sp. BF1]|uniref:hypothetical protein n=1 Tax=Microbacterium sp. BF1 TaxID=2821146 RepID=UPI001C4DEF7C
SVVFPVDGQPEGASVSEGGKTLTVPGQGVYMSPEDGTGPEPIDNRTPIAVTATPIGNAGPRIGDRGAAC